MEIPDVIAVNKMDHPAAKTMLNEVRSILSLDPERSWRPPIVLTEAARDENVPELWERIDKVTVRTSRPRGSSRSGGGRIWPARCSPSRQARAKTHLEHAVEDDPELRRVLDAVQAPLARPS